MKRAFALAFLLSSAAFAEDRPFTGTRTFIGGAIGGGPGAYTSSSFQKTLPGVAPFNAQFFSALQAGVMLERVQLQIEFSPGSYIASGPLHVFQANASVAYFLRLGERISWPFRFGLGGALMVSLGDDQQVVFDNNGNPVSSSSKATPGGAFMWRADIFGLVINAGEHLVLEALLPSFRIFKDNGNGILFSWITSFGIDWMF